MHSSTHAGGQKIRVHPLLQQLAPEYFGRFGASMPRRHRQVLQKILACRTPALGGHMFGCPDCPTFAYRYHSCNDRHCPLCGQTDADQWLDKQGARLLLPVPYFLITFTVPQQLRLFIRSYLQPSLDLFFAVTSGALQDLAGNPKRLGGQLGMLGVLHTWARNLIFHPHIHYLVPGGALSLDGRQWVPARKKFLLHHQALGAHVRTLFKERLLKDHPALFAEVPARVWELPWNVGCQAAGSGQNALRYLSRYVFKTATANRAVEILPDGRVLWTYRQSKTRTFASIKLQPMEFMGRLLQHILPSGFARVRTFGWLHPAAKVRANRVRALLREKPVLTPAEKQAWTPPPEPTPQSPPQPQVTAKGPCCPRCHQPMQLLGSWHRSSITVHPRQPP